MKRILLAATAALSLGTAAALPMQASAQTVTGTVTLTGHVTTSCQVLNGGPGGPGSFSDSKNFGELDASGGVLTSGLAYSSATNIPNLKVVCTGVSPTVNMTATSMTNGVTPLTPGYANQVNFNAHLTLSLITSGGTTSTPTSSVTSTAAGALVAATTTGQYFQNLAPNMVITADGFATPGATDILTVGTYTGTIVINVTPT